jgi:hypothetical protein
MNTDYLPKNNLPVGLCNGKTLAFVHGRNLSVGRRIILKWIFNLMDGGVDRIDLVHSNHKWRALVKMVMNLWIPQIR